MYHIISDASKIRFTHSGSGRDAGVNGISAKKEAYSVTKVKICLVKYEDYEEIFFLFSRPGATEALCLKK